MQRLGFIHQELGVTNQNGFLFFFFFFWGGGGGGGGGVH